MIIQWSGKHSNSPKLKPCIELDFLQSPKLPRVDDINPHEALLTMQYAKF